MSDIADDGEETETRWRGRVTRKGVADAAAALVFIVVLVAFLPATLGSEVPPPSSPAAAPDDPTVPDGPAPEVAGPSVWDRLLDDAAIRMLRILLVVGAAFALAALTQRIVLGALGFEALGFKLSDLEATRESLEDITELVETQRQEISDQVAAVADTTAQQIVELAARVAALEPVPLDLLVPDEGEEEPR